MKSTSTPPLSKPRRGRPSWLSWVAGLAVLWVVHHWVIPSEAEDPANKNRSPWMIAPRSIFSKKPAPLPPSTYPQKIESTNQATSQEMPRATIWNTIPVAPAPQHASGVVIIPDGNSPKSTNPTEDQRISSGIVILPAGPENEPQAPVPAALPFRPVNEAIPTAKTPVQPVFRVENQPSSAPILKVPEPVPPQRLEPAIPERNEPKYSAKPEILDLGSIPPLSSSPVEPLQPTRIEVPVDQPPMVEPTKEIEKLPLPLERMNPVSELPAHVPETVPTVTKPEPAPAILPEVDAKPAAEGLVLPETVSAPETKPVEEKPAAPRPDRFPEKMPIGTAVITESPSPVETKSWQEPKKSEETIRRTQYQDVLAPPALTPAGGGCSTCGRGHGLGQAVGPGRGFRRCSSCGNGGFDCVPGRKPCHPCEANTWVGGMFCDFYECICCQDPCYDPHWIALTDAALFADAPRPVNQTRIRYDRGLNLILPDRSEFFWARADGNGKGPSPAPFLAENRLRYHEISLYTEIAVGPKFSMFTNMPYRSVDAELSPAGSGFGDLDFGTKSLILDCELMLIAFQFRTYMPVGKAGKGVGTGHVSLEPSLLFSCKLAPETYLQWQWSQWIPLGGDADYAGSVFYTHWSLNHTICRILPDVPLIGTMELATWSFQDGAFTDPILGPFQGSSGETYVSAGPGLRLVFCDKIDFAIGSLFALTSEHLAGQLIRAEFRMRY